MTTPVSTPINETNTAATTIVDGLTDVENAGVSAVEAEIIVAAPIMDTPIWKQIWEYVVGIFAGKLLTQLNTGATDVVIDTQISEEEQNLSKAEAALIAAESTGDANAIATARAAWVKAQSALTNSSGFNS